MAIQTDSAIVDVNVRYRIQGLEEGTQSAKRASDAFGKFGEILKQVGLSLVAFKLVDGTIKTLNNLVSVGIESNSVFEKSSVQLEVFTSNAKLASDTVDYLAFQSTRLAGGLEDLINSATALETFGIKTSSQLELVADVAQAINREAEDVAIAFGRIVIGDPRTKQFLTTRRGDVREFNRVLEQTGDRLKAAEAAFARFSGVSADLEGTYSRLVENIGDFFFLISQKAFSEFFEEGKEYLKVLRDVLQEEAFGEDEGLIVKVLGAAPRETASFMKTIRNDFEFIYGLSKGKLPEEGKIGAVRKLFDPFYQTNQGKSRQENLDDALKRLDDSFRRSDRIARDIDQRIENIIVGDIATIRDVAERNLPRALRIADNIVKQYTDSGLGQINDANRRIARAVIEIERDAKEELRKSLTDAGGKFDPFALSKEINERLEKIYGPDGELEIAYGATLARLEQESFDQRYEDERFLAEYRERVYREQLQDELDIRLENAEKNANIAQQLLRNQLQNFNLIANRSTGILFSIFFGGNNDGIDRQIDKLKEELNVIEGATTPLTRQEELLNRITELEAQRVTLADRLGMAIKNVALQMAEAATQAAIMNFLINQFGNGRSGGGFFSLFKSALGFASFVNPALTPFAVGANAIPSQGFQPNFGSGVGIRTSLNKPTVINNPVFLGSDASDLVSKSVQINNNRIR